MRPIVLAFSPRSKLSYSSMNFAVELAPSAYQPSLLVSTHASTIALTSGLDHLRSPLVQASCCALVQPLAATADRKKSAPKPSLLPSAKQVVPEAFSLAQMSLSSAQFCGALAGSRPAFCQRSLL